MTLYVKKMKTGILSFNGADSFIKNSITLLCSCFLTIINTNTTFVVQYCAMQFVLCKIKNKQTVFPISMTFFKRSTQCCQFRRFILSDLIFNEKYTIAAHLQKLLKCFEKKSKAIYISFTFNAQNIYNTRLLKTLSQLAQEKKRQNIRATEKNQVWFVNCC